MKACLGLCDVTGVCSTQSRTVHSSTVQNDLYRNRIIQKGHDRYNKVHIRKGTSGANTEWTGWKPGEEVEGGSLLVGGLGEACPPQGGVNGRTR